MTSLVQRWMRVPALWAILVGTAYGVMAQLVARTDGMSEIFAVMSVGYIFVLPAVLGFVTVMADPVSPVSWLRALTLPLSTAALCLAVAFVVGWEGTICLLMAAPVYFPLAVVGGVLGALVRRYVGKGSGRWLTAVVLLAPVGSATLESVDVPLELHTVSDAIVIEATAAEVWHQIVRVPPIVEPQTGIFYTLGFPRPVEATLSHEGVGGVRHASFERGLVFIETVTRWEPERHLAFEIVVDPHHTPLTTLDAHVTVGGRYFDVLHGRYEIEPIDDGQVRLWLASDHRISTHFNFYAAMWSQQLMADVQRNILRVIKARAERGYRVPASTR